LNADHGHLKKLWFHKTFVLWDFLKIKIQRLLGWFIFNELCT
jgi:hypothetical protein